MWEWRGFSRNENTVDLVGPISDSSLHSRTDRYYLLDEANVGLKIRNYPNGALEMKQRKNTIRLGIEYWVKTINHFGIQDQNIHDILLKYNDLIPEIKDFHGKFDENKFVDLTKTRTTSQLILSGFTIYIESVKLEFGQDTYYSVSIESGETEKIQHALKHFELRRLIDWEMSYPLFANRLYCDEL